MDQQRKFPRIDRFLLAACVLLTAAFAGCVRVNVQGDPATRNDAMTRTTAAPGHASTPLRVATYNTSLYDNAAGGMIARLQAGDDKARRIAAVLQRVRPDVVLLNEFDFDPAHRAADLFQRDYLQVAQAGGGSALHYPYRYLAPVNTGVPSGLDLDRNGVAGGEGRDRGNDAWGFGFHPGQYGMLVLSRYPIDPAQVRTFQLLKWSSLPGARMPRDPATDTPWYAPKVWPQLRLSSKSHWDVPVVTPLGTVHLLAAHPTPPVFDGPENRNGLRNFDEIRLWAEYLTATQGITQTVPDSTAQPAWLCDDQGRCGGLAGDAHFVIAGDYNADPNDGDSVPGAIAQLLDHPRVNAAYVPRSPGAVQRAARHGLPRRGDVGAHTGDFGAKSGTLRLDYLLPSQGLRVHDGGVFWPLAGSSDAELTDASDHHLVWLDVLHVPR